MWVSHVHERVCETVTFDLRPQSQSGLHRTHEHTFTSGDLYIFSYFIKAAASRWVDVHTLSLVTEETQVK